MESLNVLRSCCSSTARAQSLLWLNHRGRPCGKKRALAILASMLDLLPRVAAVGGVACAAIAGVTTLSVSSIPVGIVSVSAGGALLSLWGSRKIFDHLRNNVHESNVQHLNGVELLKVIHDKKMPLAIRSEAHLRKVGQLLYTDQKDREFVYTHIHTLLKSLSAAEQRAFKAKTDYTLNFLIDDIKDSEDCTKWILLLSDPNPRLMAFLEDAQDLKQALHLMYAISGSHVVSNLTRSYLIECLEHLKAVLELHKNTLQLSAREKQMIGEVFANCFIGLALRPQVVEGFLVSTYLAKMLQESGHIADPLHISRQEEAAIKLKFLRYVFFVKENDFTALQEITTFLEVTQHSPLGPVFAYIDAVKPHLKKA